MLLRKLILPVNVSGRTKSQIVEEMENTVLSSYVLDYNDISHPEFCRCNKCFQARLDMVVALGEVA